MARIHEEVVVIKLSKLTRDNSEVNLTSDNFAATVESLVSEILGDESVIVEVVRDQD